MSVALVEIKKDFLKKLHEAPGHKLAGTRLKPAPTRLKKLVIDEAQAREALQQLIQEKYITETIRGKGRTYHLTSAGETYLQGLQSVAPHTNPALFPFQQSFVLLKIFLAPDHTLTQGDLENKLRTQEVVTRLELGSMTTESSAKSRPKIDSQLVRWVLDTLVRRGALKSQRDRGTVRYQITEVGEELLAASEQYPSIEFRLKGKELSALFTALLEATRRDPVLDAPTEAPTPVAPQTNGVPLTAGDVIQLFEELLRQRHSRTGMVPIHELRQVVALSHGPDAARHETLDPLLKQLRREDRVRLIAISDLSRATSEQLEASIPGENETFFYAEIAHERVHA